jgi:hypothetical protein
MWGCFEREENLPVIDRYMWGCFEREENLPVIDR